jgi:hypothetical protein
MTRYKHKRPEDYEPPGPGHQRRRLIQKVNTRSWTGAEGLLEPLQQQQTSAILFTVNQLYSADALSVKGSGTGEAGCLAQCRAGTNRVRSVN